MTHGFKGSRYMGVSNGKNEKGSTVTSRLVVTKLAAAPLTDLGQERDYVTPLSPRLWPRVSPGGERESN